VGGPDDQIMLDGLGSRNIARMYPQPTAKGRSCVPRAHERSDVANYSRAGAYYSTSSLGRGREQTTRPLPSATITWSKLIRRWAGAFLLTSSQSSRSLLAKGPPIAVLRHGAGDLSQQRWESQPLVLEPAERVGEVVLADNTCRASIVVPCGAARGASSMNMRLICASLERNRAAPSSIPNAMPMASGVFEDVAMTRSQALKARSTAKASQRAWLP